MNKRRLSKIVSQRTNVNAEVVAMIYDHCVRAILEDVAENGLSSVPGFATIRLVNRPGRAERTINNPRTHTPCVIAARPPSKTIRMRPVKAALYEVNHVCLPSPANH